MGRRLARWIAAWLLRWAGESAEASPVSPVAAAAQPVRDPMLGVIQYACYLAGVDTSRFGPDLDLSQSGKIPEVLYISARELGASHALQSVGAIYKALKP